MKKTLISLAILGAMGATTASASVLSIDAGSNFEMEVAPAFFLTTQITGLNGINTDAAQGASGSHSGAPNGSESPDIDNPWLFFGNTGMHGTSSAPSILSVTGSSATIDMSGWYVTWNGIPVIDMGSGAWGSNPDGVGEISCAATCADGEAYTLTYTARVPAGDPSSFGNVAYRLNLTGTITGDLTAIPVPAAVWLFGSGLLGLVGVARRKAKA